MTDDVAAREMLRPDPLTPDPLTPSREMTPDELVEACERMDVVERAITIPAMWPRLILERERAAAALRAVTPDPAEPERCRCAALDADPEGSCRNCGHDASYHDEWGSCAARPDRPAEPGLPYLYHGDGDLCLGPECLSIDEATGDHDTDLHSDEWWDGFTEAGRRILGSDTARAGELDVERLTEAMWNVRIAHPKGFLSVDDRAAAVAAEYARLAHPEDPA